MGVVDRPAAGQPAPWSTSGTCSLTSWTPHLGHVRRWYQQVANARYSHASVLRGSLTVQMVRPTRKA